MANQDKTYSGTLFSISFKDFPVTSTGGLAAYDLWSIKASAASRVEIKQIRLGQSSTAPAGNQQLDIQVYRGSTGLGGGAAVVPSQLKGWPSAPAALTAASAPSSNLASTASAFLLIADATDFAGSYRYRAKDYEEIILDKGQTLNVRIKPPPVTVQLSGSLIFREIGAP